MRTAAGGGEHQTGEANSDAQEVVELTEILHSELPLQRGDDTLKQLLIEAVSTMSSTYSSR